MFGLAKIPILLWLYVCLGALADTLPLRRTPVEVRPPQVQFQRWIDSYWDTESETWAFRNEDDLQMIVRREDVPANLQLLLLACKTEVPEEQLMARGWQGNHRTRELLHLPPAVRDRVPVSLLQRYFNYHQAEIRSGNFPVSRLTTSDVSPALSRSIVHAKGANYVVVTPYSWKSLPLPNKLEFLDAKFRPSPLRRGLEVWLILSPADDVTAVAKKISPSGRYVTEIAAVLKKRRSQTERVEIPLTDLLPAQIASWVNRYFDCFGPNCFGMAKAFVDGTAQVEAIPTAARLTAWLTDSGFQGVESGTPLEMGDVLVYETATGGILHSAVYLIEGLVLSRNGYSKTYPTVVQTQTAIEEAYFTPGKFRTWVYRKMESPAQAYLPLYSAPDELEYLHLGLHPRSWGRTHRKTLKEFYARSLSDPQLQELTRYVHDKRFTESHALAHEILEFQRKFRYLRPVAERLGFSPFYSDVAKNRAALQKLTLPRPLTTEEMDLLVWIAEAWGFRYRKELRQIRAVHFPEAAPYVCGGLLHYLRLLLLEPIAPHP